MSRQVFTNCSSLSIGCFLYQDSGLSSPWDAGKYYDGTTCWVVNSSGQITSSGSCSETTLSWSFSKTGGAVGTMDLYINSINVISRNYTSSGTITVNEGDSIYVELNQNVCTGFDTYGNVWTSGIITDANCLQSNTVYLSTNSYTVQPGDVGTTINLDTFADCSPTCL